jgi:serine/threonine-protein kinase RIO1
MHDMAMLILSCLNEKTNDDHDRDIEQFRLHKKVYEVGCWISTMYESSSHCILSSLSSLQGKCSVVYTATDSQSGQPVAVKLYRKKLLSPLNQWVDE